MNACFDFSGKVALVTGGGSGIGRATAERFAAAGAAVVIGDIDVDAGLKVSREIAATGGRSSFVRLDVRDPQSCAALTEVAVETFGNLDFAFNNAGVIGNYAAASTIGASAWDTALAINLSGVFHCLRAQVAAMKGRGGSIVNNASVMGLSGAPGFAAYSASKHGVIGLSRTAAMDHGRDGIRINAVCPGFVRTPMTDSEDETAANAVQQSVKRTASRRLGEPDEIASVVLWLCSNDAAFVTGAAIAADGGFTAN